jgi:pimeloyl-ACP methyl ester carboxylesterase
VPPPGDGISRAYDIGGFSLGIACKGTGGSPTVIVEAGLDNGGGDWGDVSTQVSSTTRMCHYSRAGLLNSDPDPSKTAPTAASMARELGRLLKVTHLPGPYVLVTHSFGGLVGRLFMAQNPANVRGVVFVDSCTLDQLRWQGGAIGWVDAGREVDIPATEKELAKAPGLGSRPVVVLTQDTTDHDWLTVQNTLARLSSDSVHVIAVGSGHAVHIDKPDIVVRAIEEVVTAVQTGKRLPSCASTFASAGGRCISG